MAEFEIEAALRSLAADSSRCAPPTAAAVRRRGDRRRVAVRTVAAGSTVALVGVTAGTAYAVGQGGGTATLRPAAADRHPTDTPAPAPAENSRRLHRELRAARARLAADRASLHELRARHRAGGISGQRYHERVHELTARIAAEHARIRSLKKAIADQQPPHTGRAVAATGPTATGPTATPTPVTTGRGEASLVCADGPGDQIAGSSPTTAVAGSATPTPTPTSVRCDTGGEALPPTAARTPVSSPSPATSRASR